MKQIGPQTLSEAIRLGATLRPQARRSYFLSVRGVISSCALGAAAEACGVDVKFCEFSGVLSYNPVNLQAMIDKRFPILLALAQDPRLNDGGMVTLMDLVLKLNDAEGWTRNQIADWIETIERQQEREVAAPEPVREEVVV